MVRRVSVCVGGRVDEGVCGSAFTCVVLQVGVSDRPIWKLHSSQRWILFLSSPLPFLPTLLSNIFSMN